MEQRKLFNEIPNGKFHSCILTSYSIDFYFLEEQAVRTLRSKGIYNISVLVDEQMLDNNLGAFTSNLRQLASTYAINGISCKGVFHPKINLFLGYEEALFLIGSGNLTSSGHGKNYELWGAYYINIKDHSLLPLLHQVWHYIERLYKPIEGISRQKLNWMKKNCSLLEHAKNQSEPNFFKLDEKTDVAFLGSAPNLSILKGLYTLLPKKEVTEITVLAPFYDSNGKALLMLSQLFPNANVRVILQDNYGNPPVDIDEKSNINFYLWKDAFKAIGEKEKKVQHAKLFHFFTTDYEYCLVGSSNATIAALGDLEKPGANEEASYLLKRSRSKRSYLDELGIQLKSKPIDIRDLKLNEHFFKDNSEKERVNKLTCLLTVDRMGRSVEIHLSKAIYLKEFVIGIFNKAGNELSKVTQLTTSEKLINIVIDKKIDISLLAYVQLFDTTGKPISNKQVVHDVEQLHKTNPSPENQRLIRLISSIENGWSNPFELIEYYHSIQAYNSNTQISVDEKNYTSKITFLKDNENEENISSLTYDEFNQLLSSEASPDIKKLISQHHSIRIADAILKLFNEVKEKEAYQDEEEEQATFELQNLSTERENIREFGSKWDEKMISRQKKRNIDFFSNYGYTLINHDAKKEYQLSIADLSMYLIVLHVLLDLVDQEINKSTDAENIKNNKKEVWLSKSGKYENYDSFAPLALDVIGKFMLYCAGSKGFVKLEDPYLSRKQELYKQIALTKTLISLSVVYQSTSYTRQLSDWVEILHYNARNYLGEYQPNFSKEFRKLKSKQIQNFLIEKALNVVKGCETRYKKMLYSKVNQPQLSKGSFYFSSTKGYGIIADVLSPKDPTKEIRFIKLVHPGHEYNCEAKEFLMDGWYNIADGSVLPSKKEFKKIQYS
ncbi:hypothetical protein Q0590_28980 [Rhodocytophaga aerolata]|uniref:Phospholipase D-like domain-containing protein n=1 Tax=Rhodocytophaga aerolata TaxID=455078 RepID=A0ABT8RE61_9BACT|nr:hypothetical protein [Rhodocytophaga aerolata]MDO1450345.1 hypothetical protein [Rhodocytophaga aerolata]